MGERNAGRVIAGGAAAAIDAACDQSSESWLAKFRKRELRAYRTGYADAKLRNFRPHKMPVALRPAYKKGYWRCRDDEYGLD